MASKKRSLSNNSDVYKELDEASCAICMEHPHNAVLLICSSYEKGCRSYICDTSYRHSNCLDRYKKLKEENADSLSAPSDHGSVDDVGGLPAGSGDHNTNSDSEEQEVALWGSSNPGETNMDKSEEGSNLRCPLCRGRVLGWKVIEDARKYLNLKSRSCSHESCSFFGNYRELRRHARRVHPTVRPADVDPSRQRAWRRLEDQREYNDIVSAIHSAMPGAIVLGDYVIENAGDRDRGGGSGAGEGGRLLSTFFLFHMIGSMDPGAELRGGRSRVLPRHRRASGPLSRRRYLWGENLLGLQNNDDDDDDEEEDEDEDDEPDDNVASDDVRRNPRRRRRLTRAQSDEDQQ